ncbi:MAG: tyrosine-type recombinase/integrase [Thermoplasmatota archaeon]
MRFQRIDLGHASCTVETRARSARHMARNGFSWPTMLRGWEAARDEGRRWVAWKKAVAGDAASAVYEVVFNDVCKYLANQLADPFYAMAEVPVTEVDYAHPDPYSPREIHALQDYQATHPFTTLRRRAMSLLSSYWGARRGEQARADRRDLDLDAFTLDMRMPGKGGKKRKLPVPTVMASPKRAVMAYLNARDAQFPRAAGLWLDVHGERMSPNDLSRETWHMSQDLGFAVSFNRWRRSWQTTVRRCGVPKEVGKYLLGHQWGRDATDHYWDPTVDEIRDVLVRHKVPGFIRSRTDVHVTVRAPLPVPFAARRADEDDLLVAG